MYWDLPSAAMYVAAAIAWGLLLFGIAFDERR
jgi:hypothetical protein